MNLESYATPFGGTPQQRYATLHRAIEQGIDSDDVWCELATVSKRLGHTGEARRCLARIKDSARRSKTLRACFPAEAAPEPRNPDAADAPAAGTDGGSGPAPVPPQRPRGPAAEQPADEPDAEAGVVEHLVDAVQYLLHQHMPWLVLTTMLAFPIVVGVGGFLTVGGSPLLLAAIAALPGISVLGVVAAMGHEILKRSSEGESDVPELPEFGRLVRGANHFLGDAGLTLLTFFAAPTLLVVAGAPLSATLPAFAAGMFFAPLAFAMRQVRRDLRAFAPVFLLRAVRRAGAGYPVVALCSALAFAPAAGVTWATLGRPVWVQIALVGPLCVLPVYSVARLLGSWLDTRRQELGYLMVGGDATRTQRRSAASAPEKPTARRRLQRPATRAPHGASQVRRSGRPGPATKRPRPASAKARSQATGPRSIEGRRPAARKPAAVDAGPRPRRAAPPADAADHADLAGLPGAVVVSGDARRRSGAAARR